MSFKYRVFYYKDDPISNELFNFLDNMDTFNETQYLSIPESNVILGSCHSILNQVEGSTSEQHQTSSLQLQTYSSTQSQTYNFDWNETFVMDYIEYSYEIFEEE